MFCMAELGDEERKMHKTEKRASSDGSAGQPSTATAPERPHTLGNVYVTVSATARHTCFKQHLGMAHSFTALTQNVIMRAKCIDIMQS